MVVFFEWHRMAMDHKSSSGLPMTGEDTGLGALASPLVGYLGKVQERASSLEYCPWCSSKGLTCALRSYRINLQESVTLCTNPQCLFPLVSRSLEDVLASLVPAEPTVGIKRKNVSTLEKEESIEPVDKRLRSSEPDSPVQQSITKALVSQVDHCAGNIVCNGRHASPTSNIEKLNGYHQKSPVAETTGPKSLQDEDNILDEDPGGFAPPASLAQHMQCSSDTDEIATAISPHSGALDTSEAEDNIRQVKSPLEEANRSCSMDSKQPIFPYEDICSTEINTPSSQHNEQTARTDQKSLTAGQVSTCKDVVGIESENKDILEELEPVPNQLFWKNDNSLCWLDSLLVALVNCKSLRKCRPKDEPQRSSVWRLLRGYEDVRAAIRVHQQTGRDGVERVPHHLLQKASADLQSLRMSIFKQLQPKLLCKLGQRETPVFAMPILLLMDSWAEPLFQSTFSWEFKCNECKIATKERVMKTLPTFTNILPDWSPLNSVHSAPCNVCHKKNQRRTMILESVPTVFGLHFVDGLPDSDVQLYTFTFKGKCYSVSTVIQYDHQLKHFVTWIRNSDGSWLEYDDLKHPDCKTHQSFPVPAQEMHVVFWEAQGDEEPRACSPSSTFSESPLFKNNTNPGLADGHIKTRELLYCASNQSLNDTDIICALSPSEDSSIMDTTVTAGVDTSIGSTTQLDTFEGLSHNDIITLTLVELKVDSDMKPSNENEQTQALIFPRSMEMPDSTLDSSSVTAGSDVEVPASSNTSDSEGVSSKDPTFVPGARGGGGRGRGKGIGRGKAVGRQTCKKAALSQAAPRISPLESNKASKEVCKQPSGVLAQVKTPPVVEVTPHASPVSSTDTSPPKSNNQKSPTVPLSLDQNARWSFLLSLHPRTHQAIKSFPKAVPTPVTKVKPPPPTHSTPNPVRRPQIPKRVFPKLRTDESEGLPLKAAEMYGAFGAKSSNVPLPSPAPYHVGKFKPPSPITSHHQKSTAYTTLVPSTSPLMPKAKGLPEISSPKKRSSHSSKVPPGLSHTEALRYKLKKKLKAKKKVLDKLNEMVAHQGGASLRPDSTDLGSPHTVTSSTYDSSVCDDFLSDLLSPATTASNLSPDSTDFLEMIGNGQNGVNQSESVVSVASQVNEPNPENFLDDFFTEAVVQRPADMETDAFSALENFFV